MWEIEHGRNIIKKLWQIVKKALEKNIVSTMKNLEN